MNWLIVLGPLIALAVAEPGVAQIPTQQSATGTESAAGLQDVTVTAQKRAQNIQTVPISIAAFSAEELTQLGVTEAFDLANQIPNMNIDRPVGDSAVRYFIRGVGTQDYTTLATSPAAVYLAMSSWALPSQTQ